MYKENVVHLYNGVYTVEKNDTLKFAGKWMDLENIILSEVTQMQRDKYNMYSLISGFRHKGKKTSLQITIPENLDNNEDPKRDIHRPNLHGK